MKLYIIRGLPGSGKSTLAQTLAPLNNVAADDFMVDKEGNYAFDFERLEEVHESCFNQVEAWMATSRPEAIAAHNTFGHYEHFERYIELAERWGYFPVILECQNDWGSEHEVPPENIRRMARYWQGSQVLYYERLLAQVALDG